MNKLDELNKRLLVVLGLPKESAEAVMERIEELESENTRLRDMLTRLRPRTLVVCRNVNGNSMEPTGTTREIDALLANTQAEPRGN